MEKKSVQRVMKLQQLVGEVEEILSSLSLKRGNKFHDVFESRFPYYVLGTADVEFTCYPMLGNIYLSKVAGKNCHMRISKSLPAKLESLEEKHIRYLFEEILWCLRNA